MSKLDDFIKEQDFYKSDTAGVIRKAHKDIINVSDDGYNEVAIEIIGSIISAISDEYGD